MNHSQNKQLVRSGHEFAAAMSADTPIIEIAKIVTRLACALDVQTVRAEVLTAELQAATNAEIEWEKAMRSAVGEDGIVDVIIAIEQLKSQRDALASENGQMLRLLTDISENHLEYLSEGEDCMMAGVPLDYVSEINAYVSRDVEAENPFMDTDAYLAEIRKQGVIEFAAAMAAIHAECQAGGYFDRQVKVYAKAQELAESYLKQRSGEKAV
ncbi:hypothetical protein NGJ69_17170 [Atlantibacter hermannii]|uniref:hypothetical protein n=1 Tax=Atlantibacter hermannii TaxID=565 RepID=UPI002DBC1539|nr:hypothetical protein [Atlantibacter hermannii]MEB7925450.1 hypothetical protein [Atlantibacter hermannii]